MSDFYQVVVHQPVSGKQIMAAVESLAHEFHKEVDPNDDTGRLYVIGQNSDYPYADLLIGVGPSKKAAIAEDETYTEVYVIPHSFFGEKLVVDFTKETEARAMTDFRNLMEVFLNPRGLIAPTKYPKGIEITVDGIRYTVGQSAIDKGVIILPDGVVLVVNSWLESHPPQLGDYTKFQSSDLIQLAALLNAVVARKL